MATGAHRVANVSAAYLRVPLILMSDGVPATVGAAAHITVN